MSELDITLGALRELSPYIAGYVSVLVVVTWLFIDSFNMIGECNE